jgi:hypothetical protein
MTQKITLHADIFEVLNANAFIHLGNLEKRMLSHVNPSEPLEIILDGDEPKNAFGFISHYFYDVIDILVDVYGSWDKVLVNVNWTLRNGTLSRQKAEFLEDVLGGMQTNVHMEDFNEHS